MEQLSLAGLLEDDREMVLAKLAGDRALGAAQAALEAEVDRVMYRYVEQCGDETLRDCAQYILQAVKNTLPMMDVVGEARAWKRKQETEAKPGIRLRPMSLTLLAAGLLLIMACVLGLLIGGRAGGVLAFARVLLPVALGCACLFLSGARAARPVKSKRARGDEPAERTEFLVDAEKAWHCLKGAVMLADGQLQRIRQEKSAESPRSGDAESGGQLAPEALELFAGLLESAYAASDESAREAASAIRFYLHNAQIDVVDYGEGNESWFEFLPAPRPGTIRPALASGGKLVRKGLASA